MSRIIRLKYPAICGECGSALTVGTRAAYYGNGVIFGRDGCHDRHPEEPRPAPSDLVALLGSFGGALPDHRVGLG